MANRKRQKQQKKIAKEYFMVFGVCLAGIIVCLLLYLHSVSVGNEYNDAPKISSLEDAKQYADFHGKIMIEGTVIGQLPTT